MTEGEESPTIQSVEAEAGGKGEEERRRWRMKGEGEGEGEGKLIRRLISEDPNQRFRNIDYINKSYIYVLFHIAISSFVYIGLCKRGG